MSHTSVPAFLSPLSPPGPLRGTRARSTHLAIPPARTQSAASLVRPDARAPAPPSPARAQHANGLRAQLHHLLPPRHALFRARLAVHQISSVPLVHGEFGVRWKFKNAHHMPGARAVLLGRVKGRSKGKEKETSERGADGQEEERDDSPVSADGSPAAQSAEDAAPADAGYSRAPLFASTSSTSLTTAPSSSSASIVSSNRTVVSQTPHYADYLNADWLPSLLPSPVAAEVPSLSSTPIEAYAPARGMTDFVKLKDHNVTWEHTLDIVVRMDVERDTANLLPNELKLVVMQRVVQGDPDAPHNPRLGALYLNLAEYASAGPVTRKYLLRESKTNATLKLTIQLEHVGGEAAYNAPPLPKAEILGGIAGLLDKDVYRTRPKALDLHSLYQDQHRSGAKSARAGTAGARSSGVNGAYEDMLMNGLPFDVARLPMAYGPKTTETLIEAIFNPVPTSSTLVSPFTYYAPPAAGGANDAERASVCSAGSSSEATVHTMKTGSTATSASGQRSVSESSRLASEEGEEGQRGKPWWKKIASRPGTPAI